MAEPGVPSAPTPEECIHPHPLKGVMAHEFGHYQGARGPEGLRRTVTYYGPVVGGLTIDAWHCEVCGLLRLAHPDGRRDERRLHPGPQPGLLARASDVAVEFRSFGMQPRVSGLTESSALAAELAARRSLERKARGAPTLRASAGASIPRLRPSAWVTIAGLTTVAAGLVLAGVLAVAGYTTPGIEGGLVAAITLVFAAVLLLQVAVAAATHIFPPGLVSPSVAVVSRGHPELNAMTKLTVGLLVAVAAGLGIAGVLAVYDYTTPAAEGPVVIVVAVMAVVALGFAGANAAIRHLSGLE